MMKFFKLPKNVTIKALLLAAVIPILFGIMMLELTHRGDFSWSSIYGNWLISIEMFAWVVFVPLAIIAYWFPRTASSVGVCVYAAFIVAQASLGIKFLFFMSLLNVPMAILLLLALVCAFRQTSSSSKLPPGEGDK